MRFDDGKLYVSLPEPSDASTFWRGIGPGMPLLRVTAAGVAIGRNRPNNEVEVVQYVTRSMAAGDVVELRKVEPGTFVATVNDQTVLTYTDDSAFDDINAQADQAAWWLTRARVVAILAAIGVGAAVAAYALRYGINMSGVPGV